jgi:MOSC domain-containing protein
MAAPTLGSVSALWRYPVKSMQGEQISSAPITERGILGDRAYALLDRDTGHIASAKHPRKWSALLACRAAFDEPPQLGAPLPSLRLTLPDGSVISSAQPDADKLLSHALGRAVALVTHTVAAPTREADRTPLDDDSAEPVIRQETIAHAAPAGTFFDYAPLHILTTATLDHAQDLYPAGRFAISRFRPNIVVAPAEGQRGFVENAWIGQTLVIGAELRLRVIDPCPRCVVTTLAQADLPHDPAILRTLGRHNTAASATLAPGVIFPAIAGIYARVLRDGMLCCNAAIRLESGEP